MATCTTEYEPLVDEHGQSWNVSILPDDDEPTRYIIQSAPKPKFQFVGKPKDWLIVGSLTLVVGLSYALLLIQPGYVFKPF